MVEIGFQGSLNRSVETQATPNDILLQQIVADLEKEICQHPKLASFGPYHKDTDHPLPFEKHKKNFRVKFLKRIKESSFPNLVEQLLRVCRIRNCYYEDTDSFSDKDFYDIMFTDGSFIVELFHQSDENLDTTWPWLSDLNTLTADLLKMGNQLPFSVLETLFLFSSGTDDKATSSQALRNLALRFFNKALGRPSDMVFQNTQQPKHLLDLFRSSLLPATPTRNNCATFMESIQSAEMLCKAGITLTRKKANSLLEIDFRKLQIPPFALKIPPVAIDELTSTILVNCVALEQRLHHTSKHFTAYIGFMTSLVRQSEDVRILCTANIITRIQRDDHQYVIKLLDTVREKVHFNDRDSYLWKQYREIDSYYDSFGAYIWCNLARHNALTLVVSILTVTIALGSWLTIWLFKKK
ncbi:hypothetical protein CRYUN_Cryun39dG0077700 [Craigia yunnanensis]